MALKDKIMAQVLPYQSGLILNAYYGSGGKGSFVDIVIHDEDGGRPKTYTKVPVLKMGGFSMSLPPVGSTAIVGFIDNSEAKPFLMGYMDSEISEAIVSDNKTPRKPPTILTR